MSFRTNFHALNWTKLQRVRKETVRENCNLFLFWWWHDLRILNDFLFVYGEYNLLLRVSGIAIVLKIEALDLLFKCCPHSECLWCVWCLRSVLHNNANGIRTNYSPLAVRHKIFIFMRGYFIADGVSSRCCHVAYLASGRWLWQMSFVCWSLIPKNSRLQSILVKFVPFNFSKCFLTVELFTREARKFSASKTAHRALWIEIVRLQLVGTNQPNHQQTNKCAWIRCSAF